MESIRLQKFIADSGLMSRRAAEEEIKNKVIDIFLSMGFTVEDGNEIETELHEFRHEMKQETTMLRNQVAALTVAINTVITENDAAHAKIIRVQEQHSIDIMELRSAI